MPDVKTYPRRMLFSQREAVRLAIADPESVLPRYHFDGGMVEEYAHWQTRAALQMLADLDLLNIEQP